MAKYESESPIYRAKGKIYRVNCDRGKPIFTHQMGKIIGQVENVLTWHRRVFVYVFNLHVGTFTLDNKYMAALMSKLRFYFKQEYKVKRLGYAWCREQHKSSKQHYHVALIVDGSKIQCPTKLFKTIKLMWEDVTTGGHIHGLENCYYNIKRDTEINKAEAIYRLSYQAKIWTKERNTARANDYGTSQIKARPK
ncbi:YagK/YfjJ domain-containing protein [Psychromonas antarctica]|uniref:YagK/YfjJ domain-containing protein n=1 Tax=Psychromonas antarctica TaxID=67573 RepID=UPI001EE90EAD|nr:inovirus-type Gp2 protein [Psychromonas antarctica]MCG6202757.1 inovirus Gp2 family protein [Psychromonas antarctica]